MDIDIELINENDSAGDMDGGYITLRGYLRAAQWVQNGQYTFIVLDGKSGSQLLSLSNEASSMECRSALQRDTGTAFPVKDIFCLPIRISLPHGDPSKGKIILEGLVLAPRDTKTNISGCDTSKHLVKDIAGHCCTRLCHWRKCLASHGSY